MTAPTLADPYEAAEDRGRRLREECHTSRQMGYLLGYLVEALAGDDAFCAAVDTYLDSTKPKPGVYVTCGGCGQHGGHTLTCPQRPVMLADDWIPVLHEVTIGSQPDVIRDPDTYQLEHLREVAL